MTVREVMRCLIGMDMESDVKLDLGKDVSCFVDGVFFDEESGNVLLKSNIHKYMDIKVEEDKTALQLVVHRLNKKDFDAMQTNLDKLSESLDTTKAIQDMRNLVYTICTNNLCITPNYAMECGDTVDKMNQCIMYANSESHAALNKDDFEKYMHDKIEAFEESCREFFALILKTADKDEPKYKSISDSMLMGTAKLVANAIYEDRIPYSIIYN